MTSATLTWRQPPETITLSHGEVHVWMTSIDRRRSEMDNLHQTITDDEKARAECFRFDTHRQRYIVGRATLRAILSRYVGIPPNRLRFQYNSYGKPMLVERKDRGVLPTGTLNFNLSHSNRLVLYAVTQGREIGVDIEYIRDNLDVLRIAKRYFSTQEFSEIASLPQTRQIKTFFDCWTRKEAFIKAKGEGFSLPTDQFNVSITPENTVAWLHTATDQHDTSSWSIQALTPASGYAAALAVQGPPPPVLQTWSFG